MQCSRCTMEIEIDQEDGTFITKEVPYEYPDGASRCPKCGLLTSMQTRFRICSECGQAYYLDEVPKEVEVSATE